MAPQSRERNFDKVGGLKEHIKILKEMIIYPLLYKELFETYGIEAPRGVLFHGPPGTGKTLMAGAVAAECSKSSNRRVSFYMRKGSDCLNKYVGESEKHLQNLFTQAHNTRPSIIFFDEIDGLVPTRSESQEQVHASVVSTLLALMDGLDSKSEVFVIGATNRIDMIDPALRRPGRFDRELYFPLPPLESRIQIFQIHTRGWKIKPSPALLHKLASDCVGYCGADIQSLCAQAVMKSFHRHFPQVADTSKKHSVNYCNIRVEDVDFWEAKKSMVPACQKTYILPSRPLSPELEPLFQRCLTQCIDHIYRFCPFKFLFNASEDFTKNKSFSCPRFLLIGEEGQGHVSYIAPAVLHCFDHLPVTIVDLTTLNENNGRCSDSGCLIHKMEEARQSMPSILYLRDMSSWWSLIEENAKEILVTTVENLDSCNVSLVFLFGTICGSSYENLPSDVKRLFPKSKTLLLTEPNRQERFLFFRQLLLEKTLATPGTKEENPFENRDSVSDFELNSGTKRRRSLRQRGLGVEYLDLGVGSKPRLRSYYRKHPGLTQFESFKNCAFKDRRRLPLDDLDFPASKKQKTEIESDNGKSKGVIADAKNIVIDLNKLEKLTESAVEATSACKVSSIIRLYEELEIVTLRYMSKWDRSALPEELEREISVFAPT